MKRNPSRPYTEDVLPPLPWHALLAANYDSINEVNDIECKIATAEELIYAILKMAVNENQEQAIGILERTKTDFVRLNHREIILKVAVK
jgi:hypothetical protein